MHLTCLTDCVCSNGGEIADVGPHIEYRVPLRQETPECLDSERFVTPEKHREAHLGERLQVDFDDHATNPSRYG